MKELIGVLILLFFGFMVGFNAGMDYKKDKFSKCIFGNEIGVNYYHFAKIGKCLNK